MGRLRMMMHRRRAHINSGKKQCTYCGKGFVDNARMQGHIRSRHTGEKPFPCRYLCGQACAEAGNRKKHEITRHGQEWTENIVETIKSADPAATCDSMI